MLLPFWYPTQKDINSIKNVQRRAARFETNVYSHYTSVTKIYQDAATADHNAINHQVSTPSISSSSFPIIISVVLVGLILKLKVLLVSHF